MADDEAKPDEAVESDSEEDTSDDGETQKEEEA